MNRQILQIPEIAQDFTRYYIYFDSDYTSQDTFTVKNRLFKNNNCLLFIFI